MLTIQTIPVPDRTANHRAIMNLTGQRYGRWTVLGLAEIRNTRSWLWWCQCACGTVRRVSSASLRQGVSQSCGCWKREVAREICLGRNYRHGKSTSPLWRIYRAMRTRCENPRSQYYRLYGGRGITVCPEWHRFERFLEDMEASYWDHVARWGRHNTTLDRIDPDGPYAPSNCRWATRITQANNQRTNRRVSWQGQHYTVAELARLSGLPYHTLYSRLYTYHWPVEKALTERR
jgi:hypothetical protein